MALAPQLVSSSAALVAARRELHTLRGASRLIGFAELAELSDLGETLLQVVDASSAERVEALASRMEESLAAFEAAGLQPYAGGAG
jgi:chemotaxis protein histidine kinase CheA